MDQRKPFSILIKSIYFKAMKAYIIVDVNITNPTRYEDYKKLTLASLGPL